MVTYDRSEWMIYTTLTPCITALDRKRLLCVWFNENEISDYKHANVYPSQEYVIDIVGPQ